MGAQARPRRVYGAWRGLRAESHPTWRREHEAETANAARWGARLPDGFESDDAECYAVLAALRDACDTAVAEGRDPAEDTVLLLTDCAPIVQQLERAYREERAAGLRGTDRGTMLEAICAYRARLGLVVVFWCPSHDSRA